MKNKALLLILTVIFSYQFSYTQNNQTAEFNANDLIGVWYPKYNRGKLDLTFEKKATTERKYGLSIEILKNGEFHNRYSAPCGNDEALYTQNYKGKWRLNVSDRILTTTEPIFRKGKTFKIVKLNSDILILEEFQTE